MRAAKLSYTVLLLMILAVANSTLKPERIRQFDKNHFHNVFGGNSIVSSYGQFQYYETKNKLQQIIQRQDYRLYSISLLNSLSSREVRERYIEENFYNQFPGRPNEAVVDRIPSYYHSFPIMGSLISPELLPSFLLPKLVKYFKYIIGDDLDKIFDIIRTQMSYQLNSNIYVHSFEGFDRVSCVMGAYQMKYLNFTLKDVMKSVLEFYLQQGKSDGMSFRFYNQLQWYCLGLSRSSEECLIGGNGNDAKTYEL